MHGQGTASTSSVMASHDHGPEPEPDSCFSCKMDYLRGRDGLSVAYHGGKAFFHEGTIKERQRHIEARALRNGWKAERVTAQSEWRGW